MFIVSEEILERLTCFKCNKYLSVKPIKVYPNRGIKCGRCSDPADAGVVSLYGVLAEQALFRCVNRFEGCNQLLSYSDVGDHEKICCGKEYDCLCCIEPFKGTAYNIYIHFKKQHADRLLVNTPEFVLEIDSEIVKTYLFRKNDLLFYVNARYNKSEDELELYVMYFGMDLEASKISQMFTLHSLDGKLKHKTKRKSCCSVTGGNVKCFKINIATDDFSKNVIVCRFDLDTEYVENFVALPDTLKKIKQDPDDKVTSQSSNNVIKPSTFHPNQTNGIGLTKSFETPVTAPAFSFFSPVTTSSSAGQFGSNTNNSLFGGPSSSVFRSSSGVNHTGFGGTPVSQSAFGAVSNPSGIFGSTQPTTTTSSNVFGSNGFTFGVPRTTGY